MQVIIWRRFIQDSEEPPTHRQLAEQEFQRGSKKQINRSSVQFQEKRAIRRLKRFRESGKSSYKLSPLEQRGITKQKIVKKAEQEGVLICLTLSEYHVFKSMYLAKNGIVLHRNEVARRLGMTPRLVSVYECFAFNKIRQAQEQDGKALMRQSRRAKYRMHKATVTEAFRKGLFDKVLGKKERIVLEFLYITLAESETLPIEKAASILRKLPSTIKTVEHRGRKKLEAELKKFDATVSIDSIG